MNNYLVVPRKIKGNIRCMKEIIGKPFLDHVLLISGTNYKLIIAVIRILFIMCHNIGIPPISIIGLGLYSDCSANLVPKPPASNTTFIMVVTPCVVILLDNSNIPQVRMLLRRKYHSYNQQIALTAARAYLSFVRLDNSFRD